MPARLALQVRGRKAGRMKHRTPCRGQKEHQMSVFTVDLKNQPGKLARLCEAMAGRGINLVLSATAIEAIVCGHGHVGRATGLPSPPSA